MSRGVIGIGIAPWPIAIGCVDEEDFDAGFRLALTDFFSALLFAFSFAVLAFGRAGIVMPGMFIGIDWASAGLETPTRTAAR